VPRSYNYEIGPVVLIVICLLGARELWPYADVHDPHLLVDGLILEEVMTDLGAPTCLHWATESALLICDRSAGEIIAVLHNSADSFIPNTIISDLNSPHGVLTWQDPNSGQWRLFVSERGQLSAWNISGNDPLSWTLGPKQILITGIPAGNHQTNAVMDGGNGTLLWHSGSTCNICEEDDERNAALLWVDAWTGEHGQAATGVRNSFDGTWVEGMGYLFTDNGRDWDGDHPPEEINLLSVGSAYGWPDDDPDHPVPQGTLGPIATWTPHSSINGIDHCPTISNLPCEEHTVYVSVYGSWNTLIPQGHEIIKVDFSQDPAGEWHGETTVIAKDIGTPLPLRFHPTTGDLYFANYGEGGSLWRISAE